MTFKEVYDVLKPIAIYEVGSSLLFDNPKDTDYLCIFGPIGNIDAYIEHIKKIQEVRNNGGVDIIPVTMEELKSTRWQQYGYQVHMAKFLCGKNLHLNNKDFDIFEHKEEILKWMREFETLENKTEKHWYIILATLYMFKNNNYELTEEQHAEVKKIHDTGKITVKVKNKLLKMLEELESSI